MNEMDSLTVLWPWFTLGFLGAYHGLNPAMGWLFAVALGMQERSRTAVLRAFPPIALGHALSIALIVVLVIGAQGRIDGQIVGLLGGAILLAFGLYRLIARTTHPRWVGMRVGFRDLTAWSFLMATAHGAGLMLLPVLLGEHTVMAMSDHASHLPIAAGLPVAGHAALVVGIHTGAMFAVMGLLALFVYEKVGLHLLRRYWLNLDQIWTAVILITGGVTLALYAF